MHPKTVDFSASEPNRSGKTRSGAALWFFILLLLSTLPAKRGGAAETDFWNPYRVDDKTYGLFHFDAALTEAAGGGEQSFTAEIIGENASSSEKGRFGRSLYVPGSGAVLFRPSEPISSTGQRHDEYILSIELWVKLERFPAEGEKAVVVHRPGTMKKSIGLNLAITPDGGLHWQLTNLKGNNLNVKSRKAVIPLGEWTHVAAVRDGGRMLFYVDGKKRNVEISPREKRENTWLKATLQRDEIEAAPFYVGNNAEGSGDFHGWIDELRIHTRVKKLWPKPDLDWIDNVKRGSIPTGPPYLAEDHRPVLHIPFDNDLRLAKKPFEGIEVSADDPAFARGVCGKAYSGSRLTITGKKELFKKKTGSFEFWFQPRGVNSWSDRYVVFVRGPQWNKGFTFYLFNSIPPNGPTLFTKYRRPDGSSDISKVKSGAAIYEGNWYHVVITWLENQMSLYINGKKAGTKEHGITKTSKQLNLFETAWFDELYVYPRRLNENEVKNMYNRYKNPDALKHVQISPVQLKAKYYPTYRKLTYTLRKTVEEVENVTLILREKESGEKVFQKEVAFSEKGSVELPRLENGEYALTAAAATGGEKVKESDPVTLYRYHYLWEGNKLGRTDRIFDPFEPVKVDHKNVKVVLRRYKMNSMGLWSSVRARGQDPDSPAKELLASPMKLVVNGKTPLEGNGSFTKKTGNGAVYKAAATHPAVNATLKSNAAYDGCMKVTLTLRPGQAGEKLKRLHMDIPLKSKLTPLWHLALGDNLRSNPAGHTPKGKGVVWNSKDWTQKHGARKWYGNFIPYLWLGGPSRGLSWFADNDKGWVLDVKRKNRKQSSPCLQLIRSGDVLTLRVNFVQEPITIEEPRTIVFGLMASPAKPMPENWRRYGRPESNIKFSMGWVFGLPATFSAKYPVDGDFSSFSMNQALRLTKPTMNHHEMVQRRKRFVQWWRREHLADSGEPPEAREHFNLKGVQRGSGDPFSVYFEEFHSTSLFHEEARTFYSEWSGDYMRQKFPETHKDEGAWRRSVWVAGIVPSYRNFACWYGAEWLRHGFGLYFDNSFPMLPTDTVTTSAYQLPNGAIQPSAGIWARRKYLKRIWILHQQLYNPRTPQMMMIHMTNTHILPYMVWNECNLDLEWKSDPSPTQARFSPDLLRTETIGLQTGNIPTAFTKCKGGTKLNKKRSRMALLVHEIKTTGGRDYPETMSEFGYGLPDCKVYNYWDRNTPLHVSDPECKWLLLARNGELMLLLCTWNSESNKVTLELDTGKLDVEPDRAVNAESGGTLSMNDNQLSVQLPGYGYRLIRIE